MSTNPLRRTCGLLLAVFCALPMTALADNSADDDLPIELKAAKPMFDATQLPKKPTKLIGSAQAEGDPPMAPIVQHDNQPVEIWRGGTMRKVRPPMSVAIKKSDDLMELKEQKARSDRQKILQGRDVWFCQIATLKGQDVRASFEQYMTTR